LFTPNNKSLISTKGNILLVHRLGT